MQYSSSRFAAGRRSPRPRARRTNRAGPFRAPRQRLEAPELRFAPAVERDHTGILELLGNLQLSRVCKAASWTRRTRLLPRETRAFLLVRHDRASNDDGWLRACLVGPRRTSPDVSSAPETRSRGTLRSGFTDERHKAATERNAGVSLGTVRLGCERRRMASRPSRRSEAQPRQGIILCTAARSHEASLRR